MWIVTMKFQNTTIVQKFAFKEEALQLIQNAVFNNEDCIDCQIQKITLS